MNEDVLHDEMVAEGMRILVRRGPVSLCAYVGVPDDHPWAGVDHYDVHLDVHGGRLTFSTYGRETEGAWPDGWYWWGWDYGHPGDAIPEWSILSSFHRGWQDLGLFPQGKEWTLEEVIEEAREGARGLIKYMREHPIEFAQGADHDLGER